MRKVLTADEFDNPMNMDMDMDTCGDPHIRYPCYADAMPMQTTNSARTGMAHICKVIVRSPTSIANQAWSSPKMLMARTWRLYQGTEKMGLAKSGHALPKYRTPCWR